MTRSSNPNTSGRHDRAWAFLTGSLDSDQADTFLSDAESNTDTLEALLDTGEELLQYRSLSDAHLRADRVGAHVDGLDVDRALAAEHDPDQRLEAALADGKTRATAWRRFRRFTRRPALGIPTVLIAAAATFFIAVQRPAPVPDYTGAWRNGTSAVRAVSGDFGTYVVGNEADLVIRPVAPMTSSSPEVRVYLGQNGGALAPVIAETELGRAQSVRILLPVTSEIGPGTHRVVVLVGSDLDGANPEADSPHWARFETTMQVVETR